MAESKEDDLKSLLKEELIELEECIDAPNKKMVSNFDPDEKPEKQEKIHVLLWAYL